MVLLISGKNRKMAWVTNDHIIACDVELTRAKGQLFNKSSDCPGRQDKHNAPFCAGE